MRRIILGILIVIAIAYSCSHKNVVEKGFSVTSPEPENADKPDGLSKDSLGFLTRPSEVLETAYPEYRLTTIYKVNFNERTRKSYIGSNGFYENYNAVGYSDGNEWNNNYMPGFEAVYGYNMVNVSLYNNIKDKKHEFFKKPVLIKTLYYPSFTNDTLYGKPVKRNFFMVSAYDEDTNNDGYINLKDLRRLYYFDIDGNNKRALVPKEYSVLSSEYDPANDYMYVYAKLDENKNGKCDDAEKTHIFWIDMNDPSKIGRQY